MCGAPGRVASVVSMCPRLATGCDRQVPGHSQMGVPRSGDRSRRMVEIDRGLDRCQVVLQVCLVAE